MLKEMAERELLLYGGAAVGVVALFWLLSRNNGALASSVTKGAVNLASGAAGGAVIGIGNVVGLPDTSDAVTVGQGRDALARGDWLTASLKLPMPEFLSALKSKFFGGSTPAASLSQSSPGTQVLPTADNANASPTSNLTGGNTTQAAPGAAVRDSATYYDPSTGLILY